MVFSNSESVIYLTKNDAYHSKTKHINIKYHYIRDTISVEDITIKKVHTANNPVYMLAKALPIAQFQHRLDLVGIQYL